MLKITTMTNEAHANNGVTIPICLMHIIISECKNYLSVSAEELKNKSRVDRVTWCRHLIRYFFRSIPKEKPSLRYVARLTGCKKHENVINSVRCVRNQIMTDIDFRVKFRQIESKILKRWEKWGK